VPQPHDLEAAPFEETSQRTCAEKEVVVTRGEQVPTRAREAGGERVEVSRAERDHPTRHEELTAGGKVAGRIERVLDVVPHRDGCVCAALLDGGDLADTQRHAELASPPYDHVSCNVDSLRVPAGADRLVDEEARGRADVEQPSM
jgi:hypothetical protein